MLLNIWSVRNFGGCFLLKKSKWAWPKCSRSINLLSHHVGLHHNNYLPLYSCYLLGHKIFLCFLVEEVSHANSILDLGLWGCPPVGQVRQIPLSQRVTVILVIRECPGSFGLKFVAVPNV